MRWITIYVASIEKLILKSELNHFFKYLKHTFSFFSCWISHIYTFIYIYTCMHLLFSIHFKNIFSVRKIMLKIYEHVLKNNMNTCIDYIKNSIWLIKDNCIGFLTQIVWLKDTKDITGIYSLRLYAEFHLGLCVVFMIYWQLL